MQIISRGRVEFLPGSPVVSRPKLPASTLIDHVAFKLFSLCASVALATACITVTSKEGNRLTGPPSIFVLKR